jgi:chromosome segregation ATPase
MFTHIVCLSSAALIGFITCHFLWKITAAENVVETEKPWKDALEKEKKSRRDWEDKWSSLYVDYSRRELDVKSLQEQVLGAASASSAAHEDEVNRLTSFLHEKETQIVALESIQKQISEKLAYDDEKIALLSAQVEQLTPLEAHLSLKESTIRQLEVEVTTLQKKIPAMEIQVCQLRSEKEAALSQLRTRTTALKEAEAALKEKKTASKPKPLF